MKLILYYIKLTDGKVFYNTSRNKLTQDIKKYVIENDKVKDNWYYPSKNQIDNLYYSKVNKNNLNFIQEFKSCNCDTIFNNIDVKTHRQNGRTYSDKYISENKNKQIKNKINDLKNGKLSIDMSNFKCVSV